MRALLRLALPFIAVALLASCGGGGGSSRNRDDAPLVLGPAPEIALVFCSGHAFQGTPPTYLAASAAVTVEAAVGPSYGYETFHFADDIGGGGDPGYTDLVALLEAIRDQWLDDGTRVVLIGHSHGCVRTHAALRAVPDCPVRLLVDLDGSSAGFFGVHPPSEAQVMGGGPVNAYDLGQDVGCAAALPGDETGTVFDLEDVVLPSVEEAYEVRSGDRVPLLNELYDERWNARTDATTTGITCLYSDSSHSEVHAAGGTTMTAVTAWILDRLASDAP